MAEQLKIVIDADVNGAIAGVKNLSNVISGDFVKATETANASIGSIKQNISSLSGKGVTLGVNSDDAVQKIRALEQQLINLEALKISPDVSSTQLALFESNIQRVKAEIASLKTQALVVPIGVDVVKAQADVNILSESIETLRARAEAKKIFITTETDITKIAAYNKEIQSLEAQVRRLQNVGKKGFELFVVPNQTISSVKNLTTQVAAFGGGVKTFIPPAIAGFKQLPSSIAPVITQLKSLEAQSAASGASMSNSFTKAFSGLRTIANILPGIGIGGLVGLAATAVSSLADELFGAAFGASKFSSAIDEAVGSIPKETASIITMVRALQSGTLSSTEFKKVKAELIAQAPEFQKSFDGDKIKIGESDVALQKYIQQLVTTVKVSAALSIVNATLAESIATIAKQGEITFGQKIKNFLKSGGNATAFALDETTGAIIRTQDAINQFKPENITKLLDDTFKKLGITFKDFAGTIDDKALKDKLAKIKADFEKFQAETIAKARQFNKEFGDVFVVPDLDEHFFTKKGEIFKKALKELNDIKTGNLKIKLPVQIITDADFIFNPDDFKLGEQQLKELTERFFKDIQIEKGIPLEITFDPSLAPGSIEKINKKLDLKKQFEVLGRIGTDAFNKIDFTNINKGIEEATKQLRNMMEVANTLNQAIGSGLVNAFNSVFDAILEGKNVFKALGNAIKELVVGTIKAIAQMLILKAITNLIFPGGGAAIGGAAGGIGRLVGGLGGSANFGGIGGSPFSNIVQIVGAVNVSGQDLNIVLSRAQSSNGRF
jgi:hypothetical protein